MGSPTSLDDTLRVLALTAQQHPSDSRERRVALHRLIELIQHSGRLCHPYAGQFGDAYSDIYDETCSLVFLEICKNIDKYNPKYEVLQWVNFLIQRRFNDAIANILGKKSRQTVTLDSLDNLSSSHDSPLLSTLVVRYITEEDPEQLFEQTFTNANPRANFKYLVQQRMAGYSWQELSAELDIPVPTLSTFYQRCIKQFRPIIKADLNQ